VIGFFWTVSGLCLGSFVNVLIHRLPRRRSIASPASHCPRCRMPLSWRDNIPVLSYLMLRGRCRGCRERISPRYLIVELLVGAAAAALYGRWPELPVWTGASLAACGLLAAIAFIDCATFLIPDELSLGFLAAGLLCAPLNPLYSGAWTGRFAAAALGAAAGFAICWATAAVGEAVFKKEAMGGGDIKLMAGVGAWSGVLGAFDCLLVASLLGSVYGGLLLLRRKIKRQDPIPFGPFLSAAAAFNFF